MAETIYRLLEHDHRQTFHKLDEFYQVIQKLRYEGKMSRGRNLKEVLSLLAYFKTEINDHMRYEEKVLFPFIEKHIPRLRPVICLLLSEHDDFRRCFADLKSDIARIRADHSSFHRLEDIFELGLYFICLLRSHMWVETNSLYRAADQELRPEEKKKLIGVISATFRGAGPHAN